MPLGQNEVTAAFDKEACVKWNDGYYFCGKMKRLAIFFTVCLTTKLILDFLPDSVVLVSFCRVPAEVAAFYYGVPLETGTLAFTARGVTLAVTRACAATDFFSLVFAVLLTARLLRPCGWLRVVLSAVEAWTLALVVNSLRVIALVPVESVFPKNQAPVVHLLVGVAFFLPVFAYIWYHSFREVKDGRKN